MRGAITAICGAGNLACGHAFQRVQAPAGKPAAARIGCPTKFMGNFLEDRRYAGNPSLTVGALIGAPTVREGLSELRSDAQGGALCH
jgi:hypothetical protein